MSDTALVAIVGILGTLGGVALGQFWESRRADHSLRLTAYQAYLALVMEAVEKVQAARDGRPSNVSLRDDFGPDYYRAFSLVVLIAGDDVRTLVANVGERVAHLGLILERNLAAPDAESQLAALDAAVGEFHRAAGRELRPFWKRWTRPDEKRPPSPPV